MKNTLKIILILLSCYIVISCNQRNTEQEAQEQQRHDDSLKAAIVAEINSQMQSKNNLVEENAGTNLRTSNTANSRVSNASRNNSSSSSTQQMAELVSKANSITDAKLELNKLNVLLVTAKSKLEYENNELVRTEQFHLVRTKAEREMAIRNQDLRVQAYQNYVQKIQEAIIQLHEKINGLQSDINNVSNSN